MERLYMLREWREEVEAQKDAGFASDEESRVASIELKRRTEEPKNRSEGGEAQKESTSPKEGGSREGNGEKEHILDVGSRARRERRAELAMEEAGEEEAHRAPAGVAKRITEFVKDAEDGAKHVEKIEDGRVCVEKQIKEGKGDFERYFVESNVDELLGKGRKMPEEEH